MGAVAFRKRPGKGVVVPEISGGRVPALDYAKTGVFLSLPRREPTLLRHGPRLTP